MKNIWHQNNEIPLDEARIIFITAENGQTFGVFRDGMFMDFYHDISVQPSEVESWVYIDDLVKLSLE